MGDLGFGLFGVVFAGFALLIGVGQVVIGTVGVRRARQTKQVQQRAVPARATVVSVREDRNLGESGAHRYDEWTTVRYAHPRTETLHEVEVPVPNGLRGRRPGEEVDVVVDPEDPRMVLPPHVHAGFALGVSMFFVLFGTAVVVAVLVFAVRALIGDAVDPLAPDLPAFP